MEVSPIRTLLVDDDEDDYIIVRDLLAETRLEQFHLTWTGTYEAALEALTRNEYDVYLLDYRLGQHTGLELLRQAVADGCKGPMILLTGQGDREVDLEAANVGAADFLVKGQIDAPLLERSIRYAIKHARTLETLRQSEERFRRLVELSPEVIAVYRHDKLVYINPAGVNFLGAASMAELLDQSLLTHVHSESQATFSKCIQQLQEQDLAASPPEVKMVRLDGQIIDVEVRATLITYDTQPAIQLILSDITERKRAEKLEEQYRQAQKMEAVGQLAAGIAHDFNNLLTAINGFAELLQFQLATDPASCEMISKILQSGRRAAELVRQLLAFSRKQIIAPQILNLNSVITNTDKMLQRIISEDIELKTVLASDLWHVKIDPTQFEQVIVNLAVNARDAMPQGGQLLIKTSNTVIKEEVGRHLGLQPGEYVLLTMSDTGVGMSEEVRTHIFEPFFTTKEVGKGTGLGLATVFGIVKQSEGDIYVHSQENSGATFEIYLPRVALESPPLPQSKGQESMPGGNETILLVEDNPAVRELIQQVLQIQGYTLLSSADGQQALELVTTYRGAIHLLLTDVIMPGINGKTLAEKLTQLQPDLKILFMSGYSDNYLGQHRILPPNIAFLQKPFTPTTLTHRVRAILDS